MRATGIATLALAGLGVAAAQDAAKTWDFQADRVDEAPAGFSFGRTGQGRPGKWVVRTDPSAPAGDRVLAQVDADDTDNRFPVAVADEPRVKDLRLEVRCKPVSGKVDEACGLVFRFQDPDDYYVVRANALEDNVRLYHVVKGRRRQFAGWNGKVAAQTWHTLAVEARGDRFQVFFDGKPVIEAKDDTFKDAGKVGVWTKADSVTYFDALSVKPLP
jgi:3-keto-disaccharide hydrolase